MTWNIIFQIVGYISSALVFSAFYMKTMIPLRVVAICSNVTFIAYAVLGKLIPILVLHSILLPLNFFRLYQMKKLIKKVKEASSGGSKMDYLIPYMTFEKKAQGETLFHKGDKADRMFIVKNGNIVLPEVQKEIGKDAVLGEVGIFSPNNARACSAVCSTDCEIFSISADKVMQLYYQNPSFGFFLIRSIATIASGAGAWKSGLVVSFEEFQENTNQIEDDITEISKGKAAETHKESADSSASPLEVSYKDNGLFLKGIFIWQYMIRYDDVFKVVISDGKLVSIDITEVNDIDSSGIGMLIRAYRNNPGLVIKHSGAETKINNEKTILQICFSIVYSKPGLS